MGSYLVPLLTDIIISLFTINFFASYLDYTLVVINSEELKLLHDALNSFWKNLDFTFDTFNNAAPRFIDTKIHQDGLNIY